MSPERLCRQGGGYHFATSEVHLECLKPQKHNLDALTVKRTGKIVIALAERGIKNEVKKNASSILTSPLRIGQRMAVKKVSSYFKKHQTQPASTIDNSSNTLLVEPARYSPLPIRPRSTIHEPQLPRYNQKITLVAGSPMPYLNLNDPSPFPNPAQTPPLP